jgi:hypothetical protein
VDDFRGTRGPLRGLRLDLGDPLDGLEAMSAPDPFGAEPDATEDEDAIVDAITNTLNHEHQVRQPHEYFWNLAWDRVNGRYDFSRKMGWQSKKTLPEVLQKTQRLVWEITKPLIEAGDNWFSVKPMNRKFAQLVDLPVELTRMSMYPNAEGCDHFNTVFYDLVFSGLVAENMALLVIPEVDGTPNMSPLDESVAPLEEEMPYIPTYGFGAANALPPEQQAPDMKDWGQTFRIRLEAFNPRMVWKDSTDRKRYVIWSQSMTPDEFRAEAETRGWKYIEETIESALSRDDVGIDPDAEIQRVQRDADNAYGQGRRDTIHLTHFWGTLYDDEGHTLGPEGQSYYILGNKKFLVWGPEPSPFWHKEIPLVIAPMMRIPFAAYGRSLISTSIDPMDSWVEILNMMLDYMQQAINPPTEVDMDLLDSRRGNQLASGIAPGKVILTEKKGGAVPAITRSQVPDPGSGVWNVLGMFRQEKDGYTGMGETGATPRSRNRISAQEFKERSAIAGGMLRQLFKNIQDGLLRPTLRQAYLLTLQYIPQQMWETYIQEKIDGLTPGTPQPQQQPAPGQPAPQGPPSADSPLIARLKEMQKWDAAKRLQELGRAFTFKVEVFDAVENRRERLEKLSMVASSAQAVPMMAARVKWHRFTEEFFRALELPVDEFLWPDERDTADQPIPMPQAIAAMTGVKDMEGIPPALPTPPPGGPEMGIR